MALPHSQDGMKINEEIEHFKAQAESNRSLMNFRVGPGEVLLFKAEETGWKIKCCDFQQTRTC